MKIFEFVENVENKDPKSTYRTGNCDTMAFALHNLTGLPFGAWAGVYYDDFTEENEYEYCHLCVVLSFDNNTWLDVDGIHKGIPNNCHFANTIEQIKLLPVTKNDAAEIFTSDDLNIESVKMAEQFALKDPMLSKIIKTYSSKLRQN